MDALEELLRESAPQVDLEECGPDARELAFAVRTSRRARPAWRRRRIVAATALVALIPAAATAAVMHFSAETGVFGKPGMTENDTSQYINECAPDIRAYADTLQPAGLLMPAGVSWDQLAGWTISASTQAGADCPPKGPGSEVQANGIRLMLLSSVMTLWERQAIIAPPSAQAATLTQADQALSQAETDMSVTDPTDHDRNAYFAHDWPRSEQLYAHASLAFLRTDYDYWRKDQTWTAFEAYLRQAGTASSTSTNPATSTSTDPATSTSTDPATSTSTMPVPSTTATTTVAQ